MGYQERPRRQSALEAAKERVKELLYGLRIGIPDSITIDDRSVDIRDLAQDIDHQSRQEHALQNSGVPQFAVFLHQKSVEQQETTELFPVLIKAQDPVNANQYLEHVQSLHDFGLKITRVEPSHSREIFTDRLAEFIVTRADAGFRRQMSRKFTREGLAIPFFIPRDFS